MIGRALSEVKDDMVVLRTLLDQAVTHTEFRRSSDGHLERFEITLDHIARVEKEVCNLQEDWNRWAEANYRGERSSPESFEVIPPVAPHSSGAADWSVPATAS